MAVVANKGVGIGQRAAVCLARPHHACEALDVDLVDDAAVGRHHAQIAEGALAPGEKGKAFAVARVFDLDVTLRRVGAAADVGDQRMIDDEIDRDARIDRLRVAAGGGHCVAQRRQIDHYRHAQHVLQ